MSSVAKKAAHELATMLSLQVLTVKNFAHELLNGASADKTRALIQSAVGGTTPQHALGRRAAADVSGADEEDALRHALRR